MHSLPILLVDCRWPTVQRVTCPMCGTTLVQAEEHLAALPAKQRQLVEQEAALQAAARALDDRDAELRPREAAAEAAEAHAAGLAAAEAALADAEAELQERQVCLCVHLSCAFLAELGCGCSMSLRALGLSAVLGMPRSKS